MAGEALSLAPRSSLSIVCHSSSGSTNLQHALQPRASLSCCSSYILDTELSSVLMNNVSLYLPCRSPLECFYRNDTSLAPTLVSRFRKRSHQRMVNGVKRRALSVITASDRSTNDRPVFVLNDKPERRLLQEKPKGRLRHEKPQRGHNDDNYAPLTFDPDHRSGYVALIGKPNVGKSTLMNQMIGQKLSIVTSKPQTTRHRILGICSGPGFQMILYDTPGMIVKRMHKLDEMMMQNVRTAAINADCVLVIADAVETPQQVTDMLEEGAETILKNRPTLLVLNKKDLVKPGEIAKKIEWYQQFGGTNEVIAVSAKFGQGMEEVKSWLVGKLPLGPSYYPKDHVSDQPEKFFAAEIVREKIFLQYMKEIPYVCQVNVITYVERDPPAKDFIEIEIVVERDSQKAILIGKDGSALKILSTAARLDIEDFLGREVYMEIRVKVKENWRKNEDLLKYYGYSGHLVR